MTLGERIRAARNAKGLTQKQLAEKIGAKHNSISDWENDKNCPDTSTIQHLCQALDCEPNYFLGSDLAEEPPELSESALRAAFWGGATGLSPEEEDELWEDVRSYAAFKRRQREGKK